MSLPFSRRTFLGCTSALTLSGCDVGLSGVHWDLSMPWGPSEYHVTNALRFADDAYTLTDGRLTIHVHPGAVLGIKGPESLRAVEEGIVDMADTAGFHQVGTEPIMSMESLPYLVEDMDELAVLYGLMRPAVEAACARHGIRVLYIVPWPNQNFFFDVDIKTVNEFAGLTMRTYDKLSTDLVLGLGMTPIQMPSPDVVPALASGSLDGAMTSTTTAAAQKFWEFLSYTMRSNHTWSCNILMIDDDSWGTLSQDDQMRLTGLAKRLEPEFWEIARHDDIDKLRVLEANGMTTQVPDADLMASMRSLALPIWRRFIKETPEAQPILQEFLRVTGKQVKL
jgi:TRAP-type C4-dicarboxylate transport system substrate-binding protein